MDVSTSSTRPSTRPFGIFSVAGSTVREKLEGCRVVRRNGQVVPFNEKKIFDALSKAFDATNGIAEEDEDQSKRDSDIQQVVEGVLRAISSFPANPTSIHIESIQDQVELALQRCDHHTVAQAYKKYREERHAKRVANAASLFSEQFTVIDSQGNKLTLDPLKLLDRVKGACVGLSEHVSCNELISRVTAALYDNATVDAVENTLVMEAATLIEKEPDYSILAARLLLDTLCEEVIGEFMSKDCMAQKYPQHLAEMVEKGIRAGLIDVKLRTKFDLARLGKALKPARDLDFTYLGLKTLYDRYMLKIDGRCIELPQTLLMRVAMGLSLNEDDPTGRATEFYELLSSFRFMNSTPTLFNSGTTHSQLSSCYLSTVPDDLNNIFDVIKDNALLSKYAGGLGNDWTPVRAMGSHIKGTNGSSQGVVPFLRIVNDTAVAVNQGGKRRGAVCCYLETWHLDILEFLDLRKNTGDERRRTHDMHTANWIPDLFLKRLASDGNWTLLSPSDAPDLHDKTGRDFEREYEKYEHKFDQGKIRGKKIAAAELWRKMVIMLYETGHPWITFKDACNLRSPQRHTGVVHSSNLCTEITLNTSSDEIAVCNLGSVNLHAHMRNGKLDKKLVKKTVATAMRMLDNVIDINYYAVNKARDSNKRHRPVGLGLMGFQDCLYEMGISYNSEEAVEFADNSTELVAYCAYWASSDLAAERGTYETYQGSYWSQGVLPPDSLEILAKERMANGAEPRQNGDWLESEHLRVNISAKLDWDALRKKILRDGMRNSNCVAIAPTATIANIVGVTASIEPTYEHIYAKTNLSGEFKNVNKYFVRAMRDANLWDEKTISEIKSADGNISAVDSIPEDIRKRFPTAFNIDPKWLIEAASRRQKWIDQSQSLNLYVPRGVKGRDISAVYRLAWKRGLKTTYYLRSTQAASTEKYSTQQTGNLNLVPLQNNVAVQSCSIDSENCDACQ